MQMNPIVKKDIRVQARSYRMCISVFIYELILAIVFFIAMLVLENVNQYSNGNIYSRIVYLYPVLGMVQLCILGVVIPVRTASAISGEKERQTFDIMMTTSMSEFSIIGGKVMTAMVRGMFFVVASMPVMALAFVIGGMSWWNLFWFLAVALLVSFFSASIGIFCSSVCRKSITAVILSYIFYVVFFAGTFLPTILYDVITIPNYSAGGTQPEPWLATFCMLLNPGVYLFEFFARMMMGNSPMASTLVNGYTYKKNSILGWLTGSENRWLIISTLLFVGVSFLFLFLASRRINPMRGKKKTNK